MPLRFDPAKPERIDVDLPEWPRGSSPRASRSKPSTSAAARPSGTGASKADGRRRDAGRRRFSVGDGDDHLAGQFAGFAAGVRRRPARPAAPARRPRPGARPRRPARPVAPGPCIAAGDDVDAADAAGLVAGRRHPQGRADHRATVADQGGRALNSSGPIGARVRTRSTGSSSASATVVAVWSTPGRRRAPRSAPRCADSRSRSPWPPPLGQLHRVGADRAAGAVDQHPAAGLEPAVLEQPLEGGQPDRRQRRGVGEGTCVGALVRISAGARTYSAEAPSAMIGRKPTTSSPTATPSAPSPTSSTVPATSRPGMWGRVTGNGPGARRSGSRRRQR